MYAGDLFVGTPTQNSSNVAYWTHSEISVIPDIDCLSCGNETWYNAGYSSTFNETDESDFYFTNGVFGGVCINATETVSATSNLSLAISDFPFCYL